MLKKNNKQKGRIQNVNGLSFFLNEKDGIIGLIVENKNEYKIILKPKGIA